MLYKVKTGILFITIFLISCEPEKVFKIDADNPGLIYADITICSVDVRLLIENGVGKQVEIKNNNDASVIVQIKNDCTGATVVQNCLWPDGEDSEPSTGYTTDHELSIAIYKGEGEFLQWTCSKTVSDLFDVFTLCDEGTIKFSHNSDTNPDNNSITDNNTAVVDDEVTADIEKPDEDAAVNPVCGNNKVESGEVCDGNSISCIELGYMAGIAVCKNDCSGFSAADCTGIKEECVFSSDCDSDQVCASDGVCVSPYGKPWQLVIVSAVFGEKMDDGSSWDAMGGLPDPSVRVVKNGEVVFETSEKSNTLTPEWNESTAISINEVDTLVFEIIDNDIALDDTAAILHFGDSGNEVVPVSFFREGGARFSSTTQIRTFTVRVEKKW